MKWALGRTMLCAIACGLVVWTMPSAQAASRAEVACVRNELGASGLSRVRAAGDNLGRLSARDRAVLEGCLLTGGGPIGKSSRTPPVLTVSPIDPALVSAMSRFRSCSGHDYSGRGPDGRVEKNRSMKHYLYLTVPWTQSGAVSVVAPFAGKAVVSREGAESIGSWIRVVNPKGWVFTVFHADPAVRSGQRVSVGQSIATFPPAEVPAKFPDRLSEPQANFDFTLQSTDGRLASFVDYLAPQVAAAWAARGFTAEAVSIPKSQRDAVPCPAGFPEGPGSAGYVAAAP